MIFISYASEDHAYAAKLYAALRACGLEPWMDKPPAPFQGDGLQVGQRWLPTLVGKIRGADYIILVLSPRSVSKRGFVSREFRLALDLMNELPDDQLLVFPILAEDCNVPSLQVGSINLKDIQWEKVVDAELSDFANRLCARLLGVVS
nr:toll/interleukin-1 receptor domain-containing protein [Mesorhizobium loti]